jgi:hypothetical protein
MAIRMSVDSLGERPSKILTEAREGSNGRILVVSCELGVESICSSENAVWIIDTNGRSANEFNASIDVYGLDDSIAKVAQKLSYFYLSRDWFSINL